MQYLANSWDKIRTDQEAIELLMAAFDINQQQAILHVNMAKEEYGPVGSPLLEIINEGFEVTDEMVDKVVKELKVDTSKVDREQFKAGMKIEQEHHDITHDSVITTAKIALAHLAEKENYYSLLKKAGL